MGGENLNVAMDANPILGSPPHGRGKGQVFRNACAGDGITPAWAGKSSCLQLLSGMPWDHPRVGGEKLGRMAVAISVIGSPPRGRGKVVVGANP